MYLLILNGKKLIYRSLEGLFENLEYNLKMKKNMLKGLEIDHYTPEETNDFILENNILNFDFDIKKLNEEEYEKVKNQSKLMSSSIDFQE
jgi:outer membrane protein OmpA-like peptidoglycan-associated protein